MIRGLLSLFSWRYPMMLAYMLQATEYQTGPYLRWFWRTTNFARVTYRRDLDRTRAARLLLLTLRTGMALQIVAGLVLVALWYWRDFVGGWQFGLALILSYPLVWAHLVVLPLALGRWLIVLPKQRRLIRRSEHIFREHKGVIVAVAGSYGKTSMKELLLTVLSEGKTVAATPANKNVAISHAYFAQRLTGQEDVVIIEYGEAGPGDVAKFAAITHPSHVVITGVAPAHLDRYKTTERATEDIFSAAAAVEPNHVYVNAESNFVAPFLENTKYETYDHKAALGWKISEVQIDFSGVSFTMKKTGQSLHLKSGLLGLHQVGPLAFVAAFAHQCGLTPTQIEAGIARTVPFEHRMMPYQKAGACIIDDSYNGNIEGIRAGTALLKALPARRKIYVTPGLVDQGDESEKVHREMGKLIAAAGPDIVVLMKNSAAAYIEQGLHEAGFKKELRIEDDPLDFYTNLDSFVAAGDVVLLQNDWTDNYH